MGCRSGSSCWGEPWSEQQLLAMAYAFEQLAGHRVPPPLFEPQSATESSDEEVLEPDAG